MADTYANRTLRELVRVIASRFVGMVILLAVSVAGVWAATALAPKWYRCTAQILARPTRTINPLESQGAPRDELSLFVVTQRQIIRSDYALASTLLVMDGQTMPAPTAPTADALDAWGEKVRLYIAGDPDADVPGHREYLDEVRDRIEVVTPGGADATFSQTFEIRVSWPEQRGQASKLGVDPRKLAAERAYRFIQALIQAYRMRVAQLESRRTRQVAAFMKNQAIASAKADLTRASGTLQRFVTKELKGDLLHVRHLIRGGGSGSETGIASLTTNLQEQVDALDASLAAKVAMEKLLSEELAKKPPSEIVVPQEVVSAAGSIKAVQARIVSLELTLNQLSPRFTPEYRELKNAREELIGARALLRKQMVDQQRRLRQEIVLLGARRQRLQEGVTRNRATMDRLASLSTQYESYRSEFNTAQAIYDRKSSELASAITAEKLAANPVLVTVLDEPSLPDVAHPQRPILWLNLLIAAVTGVVVALVYAFLADHFDHSVKGESDARRHVGSEVLGSVPKLARRIVVVKRTGAEAGSDAPAVRASLSAPARDAFGGLWASLFFAGRPHGKTLMLCAPGGEGASTVSAGLALAGSDAVGSGRIALIDLNVRSPALQRIFRLEQGPGIGEIIVDGADWSSAARRVNPALDVFTAGAVSGRTLDLLGGDKIEEFLRAVSERYDHVLLDVAAANHFPDAQVLAGVAGEAVLVVRAGQTPREAVGAAKRRIEAGGGSVIGLVLNLRTYPIPRFLYRRT